MSSRLESAKINQSQTSDRRPYAFSKTDLGIEESDAQFLSNSVARNEPKPLVEDKYVSKLAPCGRWWHEVASDAPQGSGGDSYQPSLHEARKERVGRGPVVIEGGL
jgi:hypothetical protein